MNTPPKHDPAIWISVATIFAIVVITCATLWALAQITGRGC